MRLYLLETYVAKVLERLSPFASHSTWDRSAPASLGLPRNEVICVHIVRRQSGADLNRCIGHDKHNSEMKTKGFWSKNSVPTSNYMNYTSIKMSSTNHGSVFLSFLEALGFQQESRVRGISPLSTLKGSITATWPSWLLRIVLAQT